MPPLKNLRHEQFIQAYFTDPEKNIERAYVAAGFHVKTLKDKSLSACVSGGRLFKNVLVQRRLRELQERQIRRLDVQADKVVLELARIGFSDIRNVVGSNGCITDPREWDDETAAAVSSLKTEKLFDGKGPQRKHIGYTQELKLWDKNTALTNLAKHFKLLNENDPTTGLFAGANVSFNVYLPQKETHVISNGHTALPNGNGTQD